MDPKKKHKQQNAGSGNTSQSTEDKIKKSYHIDQRLAHGLKVLAAKEDTYQSDLLSEALEDLFDKKDFNW